MFPRNRILAVFIAAASSGLCAANTPAQQRVPATPVANTTTSSTTGTLTTFGQAGNVDNPPPAATPDPNAPIETEILATNGANFASKERIAIFEGDVRVNDPRFQLACDKLTVYLNKSAAPDGGTDSGRPAATPKPKAGNTPPNSGTPPAGAANDQNNPGGGIDHAKAEGHVIIIQKRAAAKPGEEPKVSIGRGEWATFDNKTGDMVLHGTPSVEQNGNTHVALAPTTIMTLHKDNSMNTEGPSRTRITERKGSNDVALPGSSPAGSPASPGGRKSKKPGNTQG